MAAPVHRRAIAASRQCFTLAQTRRTVPFMFSMMLVQARERPLGVRLIGAIAKALSGSDLPFKVHLLDLATVEPAFRARIAADFVPLPSAHEPPVIGGNGPKVSAG